MVIADDLGLGTSIQGDRPLEKVVRKCLTPNGLEGKEAGQWLRDLTELVG